MLNLYRLLYQISPIFLTNGIVGNHAAGGMLPLLALLDADAYTSIYSQGVNAINPTGVSLSLDNAFAVFQPVPGGSLIEQSIAEYPFANLSVAANAIVRNPTNVSLIMMTPMKTSQAWALKLATMTSLKNTLDTHNNLGGTYTVFTPSWTYTNMLMKSLIDVSTAQSPLPQNSWRWDFHRPLVSMTDIAGAESNLYSKITAGVPTDATTTSALTATGVPANTINLGLGSGGVASSVASIVPFSP
jgi:hypothetical protein